ncbi:unnamed protein product [Rangifer tarandus platyrhynchus]|uniref:Olduvai domain-containing protein n=1 Tax=Rangifer tarandus platyrhynchus TaxID=3082113 RepID=A0ABN8XQF0_RANTA|nr:unnamed protein product [Rangifer tarandus platyrhynchus]
MAECLPSSLDLRAERTFEEINQELQLQLEKYKQDFRDLTEKFLVSQATAYSLANHLQKYKCEACKGIVESVLGEKLPGEARRPAEKLAEKPTLDERLRTCDILIRSQARELTQLRQTLQNGKDDSALLKQHLKDLLTHSDLDKHQRQGFRESLSEGYRLAERLACKLSPEIDEDEDDEQAQETPTPSVNVQDVEKTVVFPHSQDECFSVASTPQEGSACNQPYNDGEVAFDEENVKSAVDGACGCPQAEEDEIPTGLTENENDRKQVSGQELTFPSVNVQDVEKTVVFPHSQDECFSVASTPQEGSACNQPYNDGEVAFDEENVKSAVDGACGCPQAEEDEIPTGLTEKQNDHDDLKGPEVVAPSVNLHDVAKNEVLQQSQDECVSVPSVVQEDSTCNQPYRNGKSAYDEEKVGFALDGACGCSHAKEDEMLIDLPENQNDHDDLKGPKALALRLGRQLPQMRENGVPQDSLNDYYLTYSVLPSLSDSFRPYRSTAIFSLEDVDVSYARDVTKNLADLEDEENQDIISSR